MEQGPESETQSHLSFAVERINYDICFFLLHVSFLFSFLVST